MQVLKTINLNKIYGEDENRVYALKNINMSVDKGEFVAIIGPCICQPKIRSKDHLILGHFLVNKCASKICVQRHKYFKLLKI
ncbi:hypothetical protein [Acidilutibacter cellobiosedens]|uniref:hypothetical protein n=1 Tax=Acidilutibacter cellobiosedens TaxID=2507161 RepID=UPI00197FDB15|nr:hypothetical protein [Acidilutibacter cellobiosedens]